MTKIGQQSQKFSLLPVAVDSHYKNAKNSFFSFLPKFLSLPEGFEVVDEEYFPVPPGFEDIKPDPDTVIQGGDVRFIGNSVLASEKIMKTMPWESKGIVFPGNIGIKDLPAYGDVVVELVLSDINPFLGRSLYEVANDISARYEGAILSARNLDGFETSSDKLFFHQGSMTMKLGHGTSIMFVTNTFSYERLVVNREFIGVNKVSKLSPPATYWSFGPAVIFMTIVSLVAAEQVEMCPAALSMAALFFVGGWLQAEEIPKFVDIRLLMLMGTSLSFATAMTKTGLAAKIATIISDDISSPLSALFLIYITTLVITEIISNNAAAALMYPISVVLADQLGVSYKPFAMVVMHAASMAFMCPIGYPTHVMVWRPGNYGFGDFCKFGLVPNFIWMIVTCLLAPVVWPF